MFNVLQCLIISRNTFITSFLVFRELYMSLWRRLYIILMFSNLRIDTPGTRLKSSGIPHWTPMALTALFS